MCQMCQMLNIWHTKHQKTVANLQQCGHKCQTRKIIFYSTFLSHLNSSFDFSLSFQNLSLPSSQLVFFLFSQSDASKKPIYGTEEGSGGGQEMRKDSRDFVEIDGGGGGVGLAERSGEVGKWDWGASNFWSLSLAWFVGLWVHSCMTMVTKSICNSVAILLYFSYTTAKMMLQQWS